MSYSMKDPAKDPVNHHTLSSPLSAAAILVGFMSILFYVDYTIQHPKAIKLLDTKKHYGIVPDEDPFAEPDHSHAAGFDHAKNAGQHDHTHVKQHSKSANNFQWKWHPINILPPDIHHDLEPVIELDDGKNAPIKLLHY